MRILVFGITDNPGGIESVIMSYFRHIDRSKFRLDFLCNTEKVAYREEILSLGSVIYRIPARSKNYRQYRKAMDAFFSQHVNQYDAIWVNVCSLANIDYLIYAKKYGIKKRIIHSHNSQNMDSKLRGLLHKFNRNQIEKYATDFWACSEDSAEWFYKPDLMKKVVYIRNAIDCSDYLFDPDARQRIRSAYHLENRFVLGNIGRLHFQKNQMFMLDILSELRQIDESAYLILVGQGPDEEKLRDKVNAASLQEAVMFAGVQNNIRDWLSSFDVFLFPSLFEGLSLAGLEAQANGLPALASAGTMPEEMKVNDNWEFYSLEHSPREWAEKLLEIKNGVRRTDTAAAAEAMKSRGYDIQEEAGKLERLLEGYTE